MMPLYDYMGCMDYMNPDVCHQQCFKLKNFLSRPEMLRKFPPYIICYDFYLPRVKFNWSSPIFGRQGRLGDH